MVGHCLLACALAVQLGSAASLLILNKAENTLAIFDPNDYRLLVKIPTGDGPHEVIADGNLAFVANYGTAQAPGRTISVIDVSARKELRRVDLGALRRPHGLAVHGGKLYFTAEANRVLARYDPPTNRIDWIMGTGDDGSHMLLVTPDGERIYSANRGSDCVTSIDLNSPRMDHIAVGRQPEGIGISPDGQEVWVGHNGDGGLSIIDRATNKVKETINVGQVPIRVRFTPDGKRVLISDPKSGNLTVWDAAARKQIQAVALGGAPAGVLVTPDSKRAFVAQSAANKVAVIDLESYQVVQRIEPGNGPDGMAWVQ